MLSLVDGRKTFVGCNEMYLEKQLQEYLDDLASAKSTPGGGSTAALSGAMGAALVCMVARLTLSRAEYAAVHAEVEEIVERAEALRTRFQVLMSEDMEAYGRLSVCFKLPKGTAEEKAARTRAIQEALVGAALVPLEMAECAVELVRYCLRIAEIGNKNVLSDIATGATLASSTASGASWMVLTNLQMLKNQEQVEELNHRLNVALHAVTEGSQRVIQVIGERG
jgi:formiminotetrahydrofolate cyclodeaminase